MSEIVPKIITMAAIIMQLMILLIVLIIFLLVPMMQALCVPESAVVHAVPMSCPSVAQYVNPFTFILPLVWLFPLRKSNIAAAWR